jgi:transposase
MSLSTQQIDWLVSQYVEHERSQRDIGEHLGVSQTTVGYHLRKRGIETRPAGNLPTPKRKLSDDQEKQLVADHLASRTVSVKEVAEKHSVHILTATAVLHRRGVEIRLMSATHEVDEHYFDEINTPEKAYWLGFIGADGCVHDDGRLSVSTHANDSAHLDRLRQHLKATQPVRICGNISRLEIHSPTLVAGLLRHGIHPRKSLTYEPWQGPDHLMPHYWRGMIDGDGHVVLKRRPGNGTAAIIGLAGTEAVCTAFLTYVRERTGFQRGHVYKQNGWQCWNTYITGLKNVKALAYLLYINAPVFLQRKYDTASEIVYL